MGIQLGIGLTGQRLNASPARLFSVTGSRGFMFDLSDYSTQFQDTAATVPITGTAQSLGLMLDLSQGLALGAELVTNGDFSSATNWALADSAAISGGLLTLAAVNSSRATQTSLPVAVGKTYAVSFEVTSNPSGTNVRLDDDGGASVQVIRSSTTTGVFTAVYRAATTAIRLINTNGIGAATIDNISVRELAGNHATQGTAGNRPLTTTIGAGFRGIQFDGVDDWLQTAAIDFSNSDEVTVVAGVRKLSDAARGMLVELGPPSATGSFGIEAPSFSANTYAFRSAGAASSFATSATTFASPLSSVLTGIGDISSDTAILRVNGTQVATSATDQGAGNFSNAAVLIGRRGGASLPFNGVITFLFAINRLLTANELAAVEAYANARTGAY